METEMKVLTAAGVGLLAGYAIAKAVSYQEPQKMKPYVVDFDVNDKDDDTTTNDIAVVFNAKSKKDAILKTKNHLDRCFEGTNDRYGYTVSDAFECDPNHVYTDKYWG